MALTTTSLRLRRLRTERNLSQQDVANCLGITRTAYNKYENGVIQPTRAAVKLAKLFGVTTDFILATDSPDIHLKPPDAHTEKQVKKYLALSEDSRYIVDALVDKLYQRERQSIEAKKRGMRNDR